MFIFRLWQSEAHSEFDKPVHPAIMWPILHRPVTAHRGDHVTSSSQTSYCSDRWSCDQHFLMVETGYCTEPMLCRTEREKRTLQEQHAVNTYPEQLKNRDHTCTCNTEAVPADSGKHVIQRQCLLTQGKHGCPTSLLLWFHQYSMNTNFRGFHCSVHQQNLVLIKVQFPRTHSTYIDGIIINKINISLKLWFSLNPQELMPMTTNETTILWSINLLQV